MPHLTMEYSANLDEVVEMQALCAHLRDAMVATGVFPLGGVRVRALRCQAFAIADGLPEHGFIDISVRIGRGRDLEVRQAAVEAIYTAAEGFLRPLIGERPFALSLEMREIDPDLSIKRFNTIHAHVAERAAKSEE